MSNDLITQPLVLVSEIQRSGGSMLSQLFDGHPSLYAHPFEIHIGHPNKWDWPHFSLQEPAESWFERLFETKILNFIENGYAKPGGNRHAAGERFPFDFDPELQRREFLSLLAVTAPTSQRDILNAYFSSFFRAWTNHRPSGQEQYVTGFTPRVNMNPKSARGFLEDYPDGFMISIVRDPYSWYTSTRQHNHRHADNIELAVNEWIQSTRASIELADDHPEQVFLLTFERLLSHTEPEMRRLAELLDIPFDPCLLTPTYLGNPVRPNSSFQVKDYGVNAAMTERAHLLDKVDHDYITGQALPLYRYAQSRVDWEPHIPA